MNALERKYLFEGEVAVSSTVATLDARAEFVRLRQLLGSATPEASAEIDRLVELMADTMAVFDGYVSPETHEEAVTAAREEVDDAEDRLSDSRDEVERLEREVDELEDKVKEYQNVVDESADELRIQVKDMLDKQYRHEAEIEREQSKTVRAEKALAVYRAQVIGGGR